MCAKLEIEKKRLLSNFIFHYWSKPLQKRHIIRHNFDDVIIFVYVFSGVDSIQLVLLVDGVTSFNIVNSETVKTENREIKKNFIVGRFLLRRCFVARKIFLRHVVFRDNLFFCGTLDFGSICFFCGTLYFGTIYFFVGR